MTPATLRDMVAHAPLTGPEPPRDLRGWWTPDLWYVCARCASRIMARGCRLPAGSEPVWADRPEPFGVCCCCEPIDS